MYEVKLTIRYINMFLDYKSDDVYYQQAVLEDKLKDVDIANVMTSWTKQKGHPVVTIKIVNNTHITIRQNRFVLDSIPYQYNQFALTE